MSGWFGLRRRRRVPFKLLFARFRQLLANNTRVLQLLADASEKLSGEYVFDRAYVVSAVNRLFDLADKIVYDLNSLADQRYAALYALVEQLRAEALGDIAGHPAVPRTHLCLPFRDIDESLVNLVGGKSAHLGEIANRLEVPIPPGFTITTHAYLRVIEKSGLGPLIEAAIEQLVCEDAHACEIVCGRLRGAKIPRDVRQAVMRAVGELKVPGRPLYLAVRSSALGEDEDLSFAGQYSTMLQVEKGGVLDAYREVLSSLYTANAVSYRLSSGLPADGLMAVACMRMVAATASGVLYTVDPMHPDNDRMVLGVTRGLSARAVAGEQRLSSYELSREPPHAVLKYRPADVADALVGRPEGGTAVVPLAHSHRGRPELSPAEAARLAELGLRIERYFKQPQDIEWARDADGTIFVIQARRLKVTAPRVPCDLPTELERYEVLLRGRGHAACRGVGHGLVHQVTDDSNLDDVPSGAVVVARRASPRLVRVMPRVAAIVTDIGAPTGHMAALAREFRVPTIVDCGDATTRLPQGWDVTVDADDCVVYAGHVEELLQYQLVDETTFEDAAEYRLLRRLLRRLTPLQLVDPQSDAFRAENCRTLHDVIRFAHEKVVEEIIELHAAGGVSGAESGRRLESKLPLNLQVIDIGGGISPGAAALPHGVPIGPEAITSVPMRALWRGLTTPGVWSTRPVKVDMRTFLSSAMSRAVSQSTGRNLAVVSDAYVNLSLNLGYHYNMVDAYVCDDRDANHVYFRFTGGAADKERRTRRATMVREVLERLDFTARQSADLVIARLRKLPRAETESRLETVGRLIGYTRQIDALMRTEDSARHHAGSFLRDDYTLE